MVAAAAIVMTACNGGVPKARLTNDVDTFSYAFGAAQGGGVKQYMSMRLGLDTALVGDLLRGIIDGAKMGDDSTQMAYMAGLQLGQQISSQWVKGINYQVTGSDSTEFVSLNNILAGFAAAALNDSSVMTVEVAQEKFESMMQQFQAQRMEQEFGAYKSECEAFMANIAKEEGVQALDNGVYYKVITEGKGECPTAESTVSIKYVGKLIDGSEFDRSRGDEPYKSRANQFIPGFTNALTHMTPGSKWTVYIPQDQAYGERQMGKINPFSALIFELELVSVEK